MPDYLHVGVTFLDPVPSFHGRRDADEAEWPPSPLRLFQALVAAAADRWRDEQFGEYARPALEWLQRQSPPLIIAPLYHVGTPIRIAVPNNDLDIVAAAWSKHQEPKKQPSELKTLKTVRPTWLLPKDGNPDSVHYLWPVSDNDFENHQEFLSAASRGITHLGWGVDMVAADASIISEADAVKLPGERWRPTDERSATGYRVPKKGTLNALTDKHNAFLNRIGPEGFHPVPPLTAFDVVGYRRANDPPQRSFAAFILLKPNSSDYRSFETAPHGITVAAMLRHAAGAENIAQALGWSPEKVATFVLGHGEPLGQPHAPVAGPRLAFVPVPSILPRDKERAEVVGSVRRALVTVFGGCADDDLQQLARLLSGSELIEEGKGDPVALLSRIPNSDRMIQRYTGSGETWATVTPVILPGYDDPRKLRKRLFAKTETANPPSEEGGQKELFAKLDRRIDYLLRKAIRQAGYSEELAQHARIEWRGVGFWAGTELATRYAFPNKLRRFRRLHVRITWHDTTGRSIPIAGPLCLGGGRFHGIGLFARQ